jgi:hypothetical protein
MNKLTIRFTLLVSVVFVAAMTRLLPHPHNVAPIAAIALFGGAYFKKLETTILIPLAAFWLSDLALNNIVYKQWYPEFTWFSMNFIWSAIALVAISLVGKFLLTKVSTVKIVGASFIGSMIFFLISNFGVWQSGHIYTHSLSGLITCMGAGIPFLLNTILGDFFFCAVLFGLFELASKKYKSLAIA